MKWCFIYGSMTTLIDSWTCTWQSPDNQCYAMLIEPLLHLFWKLVSSSKTAIRSLPFCWYSQFPVKRNAKPPLLLTVILHCLARLVTKNTWLVGSQNSSWRKHSHMVIVLKYLSIHILPDSFILNYKINPLPADNFSTWRIKVNPSNCIVTNI